MSEIRTDLKLEGDTVVVNRVQDCQDIADWAKMLREQPQHGADFHHRWSLPLTMVEKFYNEYCGDGFQDERPMDGNFWDWVHKKMKDPAYKIFWTHDTAKPYWLAYGS